MTVTPDGPFDVVDRDAILRCFDATAAAVYAWICVLIGGESGAGNRLASVYLRLDEQCALGAPITVDGLRLEATAFAVANAAADDSAIADAAHVRTRLLDRALTALAIEQRRDPTEIAAIVGISLADLDLRVADVRARFTLEGGRLSGGSGGGWLDDVTRSTARDAVANGRLAASPAGGPASNVLGRPRDLGERVLPDFAQTSPESRHPEKRRRRIVLIALAATATLLAAMFWSSGNSTNRASSPDGTPLDLGSAASRVTATEATDPPTTAFHVQTSAPTTEPSTSVPYGGNPLRLSPGFTVETPAGMAPVGIYESPAADQQQNSSGRDAWLQLWAEPEASRVAGRWMAMNTASLAANIGSARVGWTRVAGDGFAGLRHQQPDGVLDLELRVVRSGGVIGVSDVGVSITSFGIVDADLERVALSLVHFEPPATVPNLDSALEPSSAVQDVMRGMEQISSGPTWCCGIYGIPSAPTDSRTVSYSSNADTMHGPWLSVETRDGTATTPFDRFLTERSTDPSAPTNATATMLVGDRVVHVTGDTSSDGLTTQTVNIGWWIEGGRKVTVSGSVSLAALAAAINTARPATTEEWLQLNEQSALRPAPVWVDPFAGGSNKVGSVTMDGGSTWSFTVNANASTGELTTNGGPLGSESGGIQENLPIDGAEAVIEFDSIDVTGVVVVLHGLTTPQGQVRITVPGRAPSVVSLVHVDGTDASVAFDALTQMPPYTAEVVDASGSLVRTLTH